MPFSWKLYKTPINNNNNDNNNNYLIYKAPYGRNFRGAQEWQTDLAACRPKCLIMIK